MGVVYFRPSGSSIDVEKLERVDTGVKEIPQVGVDYYSKDQSDIDPTEYAAGKRVIQTRFVDTAITAGATQELRTGVVVDRLISINGQAANGSGTGTITSIGASTTVILNITATGTWTLYMGEAFDEDDDSYDVTIKVVRAP